jgi:hypothetical protein
MARRKMELPLKQAVLTGFRKLIIKLAIRQTTLQSSLLC